METLYEDYQKVISELARFYDRQVVKMRLLKGYGLSLYYPVPNHRPVGYIDIYNFSLWKFADQMVNERLGIEVDDSHEHHTVFAYQSVTVEKHFDFINTKVQKTNLLFEKRLKELASRST